MMTGSDSEQSQSIQRSKNSFINIGRVLAKRGIDLAVGVPVSDVVEVLYDHTINFHKDRAKSRIKEFHRVAFSNAFEGKCSFDDYEFEIEDYYAVLNHLLADEENEKIALYARAFAGLINGSLEPRLKSLIFKALRNMTITDLELFKRFVEADRAYERVEYRIDQFRKISVPRDAVTLNSIQTLLAYGALDRRDDNVLWPTDLAASLYDLIYT